MKFSSLFWFAVAQVTRPAPVYVKDLPLAVSAFVASCANTPNREAVDIATRLFASMRPASSDLRELQEERAQRDVAAAACMTALKGLSRRGQFFVLRQPYVAYNLATHGQAKPLTHVLAAMRLTANQDKSLMATPGMAEAHAAITNRLHDSYPLGRPFYNRSVQGFPRSGGVVF